MWRRTAAGSVDRRKPIVGQDPELVRGEIGLVIGPAQLVHLAVVASVALALAQGVHDEDPPTRRARFRSGSLARHVLDPLAGTDRTEIRGA
jgi:hypothetical protein